MCISDFYKKLLITDDAFTAHFARKYAKQKVSVKNIQTIFNNNNRLCNIFTNIQVLKHEV